MHLHIGPVNWLSLSLLPATSLKPLPSLTIFKSSSHHLLSLPNTSRLINLPWVPPSHTSLVPFPCIPYPSLSSLATTSNEPSYWLSSPPKPSTPHPALPFFAIFLFRVLLFLMAFPKPSLINKGLAKAQLIKSHPTSHLSMFLLKALPSSLAFPKCTFIIGGLNWGHLLDKNERERENFKFNAFEIYLNKQKKLIHMVCIQQIFFVLLRCLYLKNIQQTNY